LGVRQPQFVRLEDASLIEYLDLEAVVTDRDVHPYRSVDLGPFVGQNGVGAGLGDRYLEVVEALFVQARATA
jgi:hypothetical protein